MGLFMRKLNHHALGASDLDEKWNMKNEKWNMTKPRSVGASRL
jgi:hypothetical protein